MMYSRPHPVRSRWTDFSGPCDFADDEGRGVDEHWYDAAAGAFRRTITVPYPPESPASSIADTSFHSVVWYRRRFRDPRDTPRERLGLHRGAIDNRAQVWVNGQMVAVHEGGHTPFSADITAALRLAGDQIVVIWAEDAPGDLAQSRGKQDWQAAPHRTWYHRTTGIWQRVWLEPVGAMHIATLRWPPNLDRGMLGVALTLRRADDEPLQMRIRLSLRGAPLADVTYDARGAEVRGEIALDLRAVMMEAGHLLWTPEHPTLIDTIVSVSREGETRDAVQRYVGLRSVGVADGRYLLNGRPYYLRMTLEQGYWPQSRLAAPDDNALRREVELAKELGFNGLRLHQKVEDSRLLYWCDRLGLLVWGEMANVYVFSSVAVTRLIREWLEVLDRDYNHPCIVAWVPLNESWGVPSLRRDPAQASSIQALDYLTRTLDPTRPVIANDGWEHIVGDIYGVHDYSVDRATRRTRYSSSEAVTRTVREEQALFHALSLVGDRRSGVPIMITKCGGVGIRPQEGEPWFGYGTVPDQATYLARYREISDAILDSPILAGFCYTQLTDTAQESNGLLTEQRVPKLDPETVRAITTRPSAAIPHSVKSSGVSRGLGEGE